MTCAEASLHRFSLKPGYLRANVGNTDILPLYQGIYPVSSYAHRYGGELCMTYGGVLCMTYGGELCTTYGGVLRILFGGVEERFTVACCA